MEAHEYANLFPMLPDAELQELAADIKSHGLQTRITTYQGKILDGRNRWRACEIAGITPGTIEYTGSDPLAFVVSGNLIRRHLTERQRAMVAGKLSNISNGRPQTTGGIPPVSRNKAAEMLNVSEDSVKQARKILSQGVPELGEAVSRDEVSLAAAAEISKLPAARQVEVLSKGPDAVREKAKEIRDFGGEIADAPEAEFTAPEEDSSPLPKWIPDDADRLWTLAKIDLDKILRIDKSRERVLREVILYAETRLKTKK